MNAVITDHRYKYGHKMEMTSIKAFHDWFYFSTHGLYYMLDFTIKCLVTHMLVTFLRSNKSVTLQYM